VFVREVEDSGKSTQAYVKIYAHRKHPLQRYLRKGRSQTEVRNLLFFRSLGISTPRVLAWGEKRNAIGRIVQEFIITEAVAATQQLDEFVPAYCRDAGNAMHSSMRMQIAEQLGQWTRAMHDANFVHEDLKWRNVLARRSETGVELFWIDCPKGYFAKPGATLERKKLKDCATLDKIARIRCSKEERQTFIKAYLGQGRIFVKLVITVFNLQLAQKLLCLSPLIVKEELKISLTFILAWNTANC
jgi:tRNA A-37 threonylcarbamoyl transferase component Bud32